MWDQATTNCLTRALVTGELADMFLHCDSRGRQHQQGDYQQMN